MLQKVDDLLNNLLRSHDECVGMGYFDEIRHAVDFCAFNPDLAVVGVGQAERENRVESFVSGNHALGEINRSLPGWWVQLVLR